MTQLLILATIGWVLAAAFLGLYIGERGRRLDAQRREGVLHVGKVKRAKVIPPSDMPAPSGDLQEARDRYIKQAVAEDYDPIEAGKDWDSMMGRAQTDQSGAWDSHV